MPEQIASICERVVLHSFTPSRLHALASECFAPLVTHMRPTARDGVFSFCVCDGMKIGVTLLWLSDDADRVVSDCQLLKDAMRRPVGRSTLRDGLLGLLKMAATR